MLVGLVGYRLVRGEEAGMHLAALAPHIRNLIKTEVLDPIAGVDSSSPSYNDFVESLVVACKTMYVGFFVVDDCDLSGFGGGTSTSLSTFLHSAQVHATVALSAQWLIEE